LRSISKGETQARQEIFVRVDGQLVGLARLRETLRETSRETVFTLQSAGYEVLVFTGDREAAAVQGLGCEVRAGMSAEDKARQIEALESSGKRVLFVGDGVNDAPALAAAQASIGLSQGAELAQSVAGFVGNGRDLQRIPEALELAARVKAGLRANLMFALFYNLIGMLMALLGYLNPVVAAILMLASSVTVTGRALRFAAQLTEGKAGQNRRRPATSELSLLSNPGAWCGLAFVLQAVGLIYLAQLQGVWMVAVALPFWFASVFTAWQWRQQRPGLSWQMSASMLSLGNLGMLLGWWADAKFRPVLRAGACLCGCAKSNLGQGLVAHWNWMHTGMAVASLGAMLLVREDGWGLRHWKGRLAHAIFSVIGMTLGMHGAAVLMGLLGILRPAQLHFFLSYGAMTTGMLLGMFASCALWRWVARTRLAAT
jgi:magnesium-transporting ATPase (P-type)